MKIPVKVLRDFWLAGTKARAKVIEQERGFDGWVGPSDTRVWSNRKEANIAGCRAAAEVLIRWFGSKKCGYCDGKGKYQGMSGKVRKCKCSK